MPIYTSELFLLFIGILILLLDAFLPSDKKKSIKCIGILGLIGALIMTFVFDDKSDYLKYYEDTLAVFFRKYAILCTILTLLISIDYSKIIKKYIHHTDDKLYKKNSIQISEFYIIPIFSCIGLMWVVSAKDLVNIFVALEIVTISFYVLVSYMKNNVGSIESGIKYLILGALSTGFIIFGFAWLYGSTGELDIDLIAKKIISGDLLMGDYIALFALGLLISGLAFKISIFPFQNWTPDVYQGAPTPITFFLSVASKAAGFVVFYRIITPFLASPKFATPSLFILTTLACITIFVGNFGAIRQINFKRLLAYSSISHSGFLLLLICCFGSNSNPSPERVMCFYFFGYLLMNISAFQSIAIIRSNNSGENISDFNGVYKKNPILSGSLLISAVSLAGVPLTIGFLGKFFMLNVLISNQLYFPLAVVVIGFAIGFYYYLKIITAIFWNEPNNNDKIKISILSSIVLILVSFLIFFLGIYPEPLFWIIDL